MVYMQSYSPNVLASSTKMISWISSAGERCITLCTVLSNADCASLWKHIIILVLGNCDAGGYSRLRHLMRNIMIPNVSHRVNLQSVSCIWDLSKIAKPITGILVECMSSKACFLLLLFFISTSPTGFHPEVNTHHCYRSITDE